MAGINNSNEPSTAPQADQWYNLTLGSSFKDHNPSRFCTFRYEFKPASIDKNQSGTLHKGKDSKVTVGFQNIQPGKPKVIFEGTSEDYKDNDAVLFFDGESFRLERLHRAVKRLRHNRLLSESAGAAAAGYSDPSSPPVGKAIKHPRMNKDTFPAVAVEVEQIEIGDFKSSGSDAKPRPEKAIEYPAVHANSSNPSADDDLENDDLEEQLDIMNADDDDGNAVADGGSIDVKELDFDINEPHPTYSEDEIADVDASDDEANKGPNAAEALRAQVNAEEKDAQTSSSSGSSGSESSGSGSGSGSASSSSDSDSSDADADSVTSI